MVAALALSFLAGIAAPGSVRGQAAGTDLPELATRLAAMTAVTGYEQRLVDSIVALLPGATKDRAGNGVIVLGSGERRRLVACPVSESGFVRWRREYASSCVRQWRYCSTASACSGPASGGGGAIT